MGPLASQNHLKMGYGVTTNLSTHSIKPQVGDVMLATTVEAAADLDVQILDGLIHLRTLVGQPALEFGSQPPR